MFYIIATLITGISFAPFLFNKLDIWHAQGIWTQMLILIAFTWTFFGKPRRLEKRNIPLGLLHLWVGGYVAIICYIGQLQGGYNIRTFFPYFNFFCLLILYKIIVQYLNKVDIKRILELMRYVIIATLLMSTLQYFNRSQFFKLFYPDSLYNNSILVGFIGNGTHLSGFLAMSIPLFLIKITRENILALVLMFIIFFYTGTTIGDASISGFAIGFALIMMFTWRVNKKISGLVLLITILAGYLAYRYIDKNTIEIFLNDNGRLKWFGYYWEVLKGRFIVGFGLGSIEQIYRRTPFPDTNKLHFEYLQFAFELGAVGLVLIINVIREFFVKRVQDRTQFCLWLIVIGFCLSCFFNWPAHLWLPSTWCMFAYAGFFAYEQDTRNSTGSQGSNTGTWPVDTKFLE